MTVNTQELEQQLKTLKHKHKCVKSDHWSCGHALPTKAHVNL